MASTRDEEIVDGSAEAQIAGVFAGTTRGTVLILKDGWTGQIKAPGVVKGERGTAPFASIEVVQRDQRSWTCIIVTEQDAPHLFRTGDAVRLHQTAGRKLDEPRARDRTSGTRRRSAGRE
jgi:hypothetical protein